MNTSAHHPIQSAGNRRRARRQRAAAWRRKAREMLAAILVAASIAADPGDAMAQVGQLGQMGMAPVSGVVNRAVGGFQNLNESGPGWLYYGVNAADRGLGYRGSYLTLGGFIPYAEDDLGGFWSADLRSHLSNYGGFFSNVGIVRKQFVGGALAGFGLYWDYDGDQNQYSNTTITDGSGSYVFGGGQTYQQVGISGEFLTDYGNLRSNGYIPCGSTAQTMGPLVGNSWLCATGLNAALTGADLEVGAYIPGLSDWAGMVSVGGYTFGNARYNTPTGKDLVPYFGGVYTRLDMTIMNNWDFSLQANNDSYFDWTGFARLTYRMGGSRRRTVSDQMEQPMMRNEHVVRAYNQPVQAINPATGQPWNVLNVDNSFTSQGNGTSQNPYIDLQAAAGAAKSGDIVFVHTGNSQSIAYDGNFIFNGKGQYLIGEGTSLQLPTMNCGMETFAGGGSTPSSLYPILTSGTGTSVSGVQTFASVSLGDGSTVSHLQIQGSQVGINDANVPYHANPGTNPGNIIQVSDVRIIGTGPNQQGVAITAQDVTHAGTGENGQFYFSNMYLNGLTNHGFYVNPTANGVPPGGAPQVYISNSQIDNTQGDAVHVENLYQDGATQFGIVSVASSTITKATGAGVSVTNSWASVTDSTIQETCLAGVYVTAFAATGTNAPVVNATSTVSVDDSRLYLSPIGIDASAGVGGTVYLTACGNRIVTSGGGTGISLAVADDSASDPGAQSSHLVANVTGNRVASAKTTNQDIASLLNSSTIPAGFVNGGSILLKTAGNTYLRTINTGSITTGTTSGTSTTGTTATTSTTAAYFVGNGILEVKAASQTNLSGLNQGATVTQVPGTTYTTGSVTYQYLPPVPPPPYYNSSINVPQP
ncbi:MAG: hypothetical protein WCJ21_01075 [Planctomycetota bacterium]